MKTSDLKGKPRLFISKFKLLQMNKPAFNVSNWVQSLFTSALTERTIEWFKDPGFDFFLFKQ